MESNVLLLSPLFMIPCDKILGYGGIGSLLVGISPTSHRHFSSLRVCIDFSQSGQVIVVQDHDCHARQPDQAPTFHQDM